VDSERSVLTQSHDNLALPSGHNGILSCKGHQLMGRCAKDSIIPLNQSETPGLGTRVQGVRRTSLLPSQTDTDSDNDKCCTTSSTSCERLAAALVAPSRVLDGAESERAPLAFTLPSSPLSSRLWSQGHSASLRISSSTKSF